MNTQGIHAVVLALLSGTWFTVAPSYSFAQETEPRLIEQMKKGNLAAVRRLLTQKVNVNVQAKDGATALHWAALRNDVEAIGLLIRAGANANTANVYGVTPLSLACLNGNLAVVDALLKAGADADKTLPSGETPLMTATRTGNVAIVEALIARGAKVDVQENTKGQTALMWAAAERHADVVQALINAGASIELRSKGGFTALLFAAQSGSVEAARALLAAGTPIKQTTPKRQTPLLIAAASGHQPMVSFLISQGADVNLADETGLSPLHAAIWGQTDTLNMVEALLAAGAKTDARLLQAPPPLALYFSFTPYRYLIGATPFALAAAHANLPAMRALVGAGADPLKPTNNGSTPLLLAAGLGWVVGYSPVTLSQGLNAVKAITAWGGDVNTANADGLTALHAAANNGADDIVQFLIDKGANVNAKDKLGRTPLQIAQAAPVAASTIEFKSTVELLKKAGAQQ